MSEKSVIGIDFGSDSVRAVLTRCSDGEIIATGVCEYFRWSKGAFCNASLSQFRQHPLDYIESMQSVISEVLKNNDAASVCAIGIDTTGSTLCAVDREGVPLAMHQEFSADPDAMFILWKDHTAVREAAEITGQAKKSDIDYTAYSGGIYSSEWFWAKILHILRTNEKVRNAAFSWVEHCDWISALLTGNTDPLTIKRSRCAAGHKAMWHESWGGLPSGDFLASVDPLLSGIRERLYTETFTSDTQCGTISAEWAAKFDLPQNVKICVGALDCHTGAVGAKIAPGVMVKVIGTSTCDIMVAEHVDKCISGICGQVNGSVLPGYVGLEAGQSAFGDIYAWFKRFLSRSGEVSLADLEKEAALVDPAENSVLVLDYFNGRRTPFANQNLSGAIFGLNLGTTPAMTYRSLIESTAFGAKRIIERFAEEGIEINSISAAGGISKKSPLVMQICADVLNMPIQVLKSPQACALGASIFAAVCAGVYENTEAAMEKMGSDFECCYQPDPEKAAVYEKLYKRYCDYARSFEELEMRYVQ